MNKGETAQMAIERLELRVAELEKGMSKIIARCHDGYGDKWTINHIFDIAHGLIQKQAAKKEKDACSCSTPTISNNIRICCKCDGRIEV